MIVQCGDKYETQYGEDVRCQLEDGHYGKHHWQNDEEAESWGKTLPNLDFIMALKDDELRDSLEMLENYRPGSKAKLLAFLAPEPSWPERLPKELYLTVHDGRHVVYFATSPQQAINQADQYPALPALVYRVTAIEVEEMAVQREVIRQGLVPKGTEVTS